MNVGAECHERHYASPRETKMFFLIFGSFYLHVDEIWRDYLAQVFRKQCLMPAGRHCVHIRG